MSKNRTEALVQHSRRSLGVALVLILAAGVKAMLGAGLLGTPSSDFRAWGTVPFIIGVTAIAMRTGATRPAKNSRDPDLRAVLDDELRQASLNKAYRNGFFAILIVQPLLMCLLPWTAVVDPAAVMASATLTVGATAVLGSLLYYDR